MAFILSIDLAYKSYADFGFCLLEESAGKILNIQYISYQCFGLLGIPEKESFVQTMLSYCLTTGVSILMLDGPQGWKDPDNGLLHQRVCEKLGFLVPAEQLDVVCDYEHKRAGYLRRVIQLVYEMISSVYPNLSSSQF